MRRVFALMFGLAAAAAMAHGALSDRIAILDDQIKGHPAVADLYVARADLLAQDGVFDRALADLGRAEKLDPKAAVFAVLRAQILLDAKRPKEAVAAVAGFAKANPKHGQAWWLLGQARLLAGDAAGAGQALDAAIPLMDPLLPDHVLAQAAAQQKPEEALKRLESGIGRLGPLVVLEERAVALEAGSGRKAAALRRLDGIIAEMKRRKLRPWKWEKWRAKLADDT